MSRHGLFLSSVQKDFAAQRFALRDFLQGDPLLRRFFEPVLFEDLPAEAGLPEPVFSLDDGFWIVLGRTMPLDVTQDTEQPPRAPRRPRERILALMQQQPTITARELAEALALSFDGVSYHLKKLRAEGRVRHEGPTKAGRWVVLPPIQEPEP
jgi:predicted HTH transcriptional regulator